MTPSQGHGARPRRWRSSTVWSVGERPRSSGARPQVRGHQGAPGVDGRTGDDRGASRTTHGPRLRAAIREGTSAPQPVRRTAIPTPGGGSSTLGLPTGRDRGRAPVLRPDRPEDGDPTCAERRDGVRLQRRAHQAVGQAQASTRDGDPWGVDRALETCVAQVPHDVWRSRVRQRVQARRVVRWSPRCLNAGVWTGAGRVAPTGAGTPPGGARSPLRATLRRDALDPALAKRGPRVVREADEATIAVRSRPAGARVMASVTRVLQRPRRLQGQEAKSAVARPWHRPCLGVTCTQRLVHRRHVRATARKACQAPVRALTGRTRGRSIRPFGAAQRQLRLGWRAVCGVAAVRAPRRDLDTWRRRRRRSAHGQPVDRRGERARRTRGVGRQVAWNTVKSAPGPWRLRPSPALAIARPQRDGAALGLPSLFAG
jgi:RNA-directed DNA polymerase